MNILAVPGTASPRQLDPEGAIRAKNYLGSTPWASDGLEPLAKVTLNSKIQGKYSGGVIPDIRL